MIGVFDSGVGGLTVLRAIKKQLPSADILYFGDIRNAPYGSKSREELSELTVQGIQFLQSHGARNIVSACNSVSASLAISLLDAFSLTANQLIEMVGPTVSFFRRSKSRILLCATPATIRSGLYQNAFRMIGIEIQSVAIADLAGAIEFGSPIDEQEKIISEALGALNGSYDVLILGCTHYPLAIDVFRRVVSTIIFDPAEAVANRAERQFFPQEAGDGIIRFVISKDSKQFRDLVEKLFSREKYSVEVLE